MFRKKVHPENSTIGQKSGRNRKNENKKKIMNDGGYNKGYIVNQEEDSASYREHWIKTDADCKYTLIFHRSCLSYSVTYIS